MHLTSTELDEDTRVELELGALAGTIAFRDAQRAEIVLFAAGGRSCRAIGGTAPRPIRRCSGSQPCFGCLSVGATEGDRGKDATARC